MPSVAMSSSRPTNGLTYAAPTLAAMQRLRRREDQRDVDAMPSPDSALQRLHAVARERHLDDDVLVDLRELAALGDHAGRVGRDDLGAHRALHEPADLLEDRARVAALLRQQRRIGRDAVDDAERHQRFDFLEIAGIDEELHDAHSILRRRDHGIGERADAFDVNRDRVAGPDRPDAGRGAGGNDIARQQRHDGRDELDQLGNREDQLARARVLAQVAVDVAATCRSRPSRPTAMHGPTARTCRSPCSACTGRPCSAARAR